MKHLKIFESFNIESTLKEIPTQFTLNKKAGPSGKSIYSFKFDVADRQKGIKYLLDIENVLSKQQKVKHEYEYTITYKPNNEIDAEINRNSTMFKKAKMLVTLLNNEGSKVLPKEFEENGKTRKIFYNPRTITIKINLS
jgi:hypothetical protein